MKLWHGILLTVGVLMVLGGLLAVILPIDNPFDNPKYAPGEACAMIERVYDWQSSDLTETYLGQGVWEVRSVSRYKVIPKSKSRITWEGPLTVEGVERHRREEEQAWQSEVEQARQNPATAMFAVFRVYEATNTVQMCNDIARAISSDERKDLVRID